jgi:hypothetical protein
METQSRQFLISDCLLLPGDRIHERGIAFVGAPFVSHSAFECFERNRDAVVEKRFPELIFLTSFAIVRCPSET